MFTINLQYSDVLSYVTSKAPDFDSLCVILATLDSHPLVDNFYVEQNGKVVSKDDSTVSLGLRDFKKIKYTLPKRASRGMSKEEAQVFYNSVKERVANTPVPKGQKFAPGTPVRIADDLGPGMQHFPKGINVTVAYTYAHAFGTFKGADLKSYCLNMPEGGTCCWYYEDQLTAI